jgi:Kdo2-lipid IVA lauroyltransferase/acyltransferase
VSDDARAEGRAVTPAAAEERAPTLAHRAEFAALRGVVGALGLLPWSAASGLGARIGALGYRPFGIRRRVVERQLAAAFPEWPGERVAATARAAYAHLGRVMTEAMLLPSAKPGRVLDLFEPEAFGWDVLQEALAEGKGVIAIAGHIGNWELGGAYLAARGVPVDAIARHMANPLADQWITDTRTRVGMQVVYDDQAVRRTTRALKEGRLVAFLADQGVKGLASTFVPFFGRPAKTPRGPAVFALRFGAPMVLVVPYREPSGRYRMSLERIPLVSTGDREADIDTMVATWTRMLEGWVRRIPEQYFWHHQRWRRQPPDTPMELRDPVKFPARGA